MAALPFCALTLIAVIPSTVDNFGLDAMVFMVTILAWFELPVAYLWVLKKSDAAPMKTSRSH
jgi:hypothetical protein